ncbi:MULTISPECIES: 23S rRNA (guanosine(2251)-2'-O)-methyltransferase RlmB [Brochothrix]|uniref:23S rRNA (Guanosine(2251)-2'-O)-methyltransferase RlmB n=1 Tax=Brochothrix thermosphacta TaxID=2756 RepID=A0A1D2KGZ7_BROTH|nr:MULTISPECIES: 23S rRNA (guanosine(2251)-2'-O)-methyltransferase RlmB [Brochothrix]SLM91429.1 23S rRNA (guanosine-2'-O-)-methyltransferase rlmB [Brachybacterium faecium]ANZ95067.1 23S rRNA (guanosine(2251)-2'-O)-methyltransferase RlmB [Brochothrix thermosphacta]ANZ96630.1 23S rRNA (guanosine(2251)-2'-O)-methyltransferase RlmB [Brochothrix thermosphacta]ATF26047.1 23S rRNA (guanosine(2251)-2'-O)-methyltransferase RlmB [Brochothrix thermosphacta]ATH85387.1 23S rRNA (guanosine(2251)-2'-O)-methy
MADDIIAGRNPVLEVLRSDRDINKVWLQEGTEKGVGSQILALAKKRGVQVQMIPKQKMSQLTDQVHQGVAAQVAAYQYAELEDLFKAAEEKGEDPFFLILDELEDPHNLGSIMRTADTVGAHGIIIPKRRAVGLTATVAKASTGAIEHVPVVRVTNIVRTIEDLQKRGVWIFGTDASAKEDYRSMDPTLPLALVIGSEGRGISRLAVEKCDFLVSLPMRGHVTSLNASVAASLLMFEVLRKRLPLGK